MVRIVGCIVQQHNPWLVALAAAICCLACFTSFNMVARASSHQGRLRTAWLTGAVLAFGLGVWTTHFVAMLAYLSDLVAGYEPIRTILSFAAVCCGATGGFWLALRPGRSPLSAAGAGLMLGAGVGAMHYIGIDAMYLRGSRSLDPSYVVASVIAGSAFACLALRPAGSGRRARRRPLDTIFLAAGIIALHFIGMTALTIQPAAVGAPTGLLIGSASLGTAVVAVNLLILALSLAGALADQYLARRVALEASNLHHLAHHDALTGLPNRLQCHETLARMTEAARGDAPGPAVLCLDLDRFKQVNDLFGHAAADELLVQAGNRLRNLLRPGDLVARTGGDEFVIAMAPPLTAACAAAMASRVVDALNEPFPLEEQQVSIGASVGFALGPRDGVTGTDLLRHAGAALHHAKGEGRGSWRSFDPAMSERLRQRQMLEHDLRRAIPEGQLDLHFQPLLDLSSKRVTGFEALVRWPHPVRGLIPPSDFIPLAEESGLILALGHWVMERACREAASWEAPLKVAVNLSPIQFRQADLAEAVIDVLARTGLRPERLELEVTEGVLIRHPQQAAETLNQLKRHGVNLALDDFGTGYSSLSYLRRLPFNKIKLDRSFVQALGEDEEAGAITRAMIALGHSLSLVVTAEGVETPEQLDFLESERCDQIQGYLISRPVPASGIVHLTRSVTEAPSSQPSGPWLAIHRPAVRQIAGGPV